MVGYLIGNNGHITIQIIDYIAKGRAMVVVRGRVRGLHGADLRPAGLGGLRADPGLSDPADGRPGDSRSGCSTRSRCVGFASGTVRAVVRIFHANRDDVVFDAAEAR